jgi:hypothetical protein
VTPRPSAVVRVTVAGVTSAGHYYADRYKSVSLRYQPARANLQPRLRGPGAPDGGESRPDTQLSGYRNEDVVVRARYNARPSSNTASALGQQRSLLLAPRCLPYASPVPGSASGARRGSGERRSGPAVHAHPQIITRKMPSLLRPSTWAKSCPTADVAGGGSRHRLVFPDGLSASVPRSR